MKNTLLSLISTVLLGSPLLAETLRCDVAVYSGVPCGIAAAIAASREGSKVILIEPTQHLGGLSTSGINTAESEHMLKWTIGGLALEFYERLGKHYGTGKPEYYFESSVAEKVLLEMVKEAGVEVRYGQQVLSVKKEGGRIASVGLTGGDKVIAHTYVDAGYEGDLMVLAGVSSRTGREAKSEYGEEAAGIRFDKKTRQAATVDAAGNLLPGISAWAKDLKEGDAHPGVMNYNFRLCFTQNADKKVAIPEPKKYDRGRYRLLENWIGEQVKSNQPVKLRDLIGFYKRRNDKNEGNNKQDAIFSLGHFGGQFEYPNASRAKREEIIQDHWDYTLGFLHFLATDESVPESLRKEMNSWGLHKDEFKDNGNLPYQLYVREARRMVGRHVVTQQDVQDDRRKDDSIGISSHFIDSHHVQRVALSPTEFVNEGRIWRMGYAYQIPYRALTPKENECSNLLVPGAASFTHVAFCTYRLESVWMIGGQAAGVAAAMASKEDQTVQKVNVPALQAKLRAQRQVVDFIPGEMEKCDKLNGPPEF